MAPKIGCITVVFALLTLATGLFVFDSQCDVDVPPVEDGDPDVRVFTVPPYCTTGTFRWAYPRRAVKLVIPNNSTMRMSVCIRNGILGNIFTVRDVTHTIGMPMVIGDKESCTLKYHEAITLRIDAPDTLYYVASILYHVYFE